MVIGVLQVELRIEGSMSLKDKRSVVKGLKDRLGRDPAVAVAEVGELDAHRMAVLGVVTVANSADRVRETMQRVLEMMKRHPEAVVTGHRMEVLTGQ